MLQVRPLKDKKTKRQKRKKKKELKAEPGAVICTSLFIAALFTRVKREKQPKHSWMDR